MFVVALTVGLIIITRKVHGNTLRLTMLRQDINVPCTDCDYLSKNNSIVYGHIEARHVGSKSIYTQTVQPVY